MKISTIVSAAALLAAASLAPAARAGTITFSPGSQSLLLGNQATVDVMVNGLGNGVSPALAAFDITVFFDSTILSPNTVAFSGRLGDPNSAIETMTFNQYVLSGPTVIGIQLQNISFLDAATLYALQTTSSAGFSIATLTFDSLGAGTSPLTATVGSSSDENFNDLGLTPGLAASIDVASASGVPEPGVFVLVGAGLAFLGLVRRRYR